MHIYGLKLKILMSDCSSLKRQSSSSSFLPNVEKYFRAAEQAIKEMFWFHLRSSRCKVQSDMNVSTLEGTKPALPAFNEPTFSFLWKFLWNLDNDRHIQSNAVVIVINITVNGSENEKKSKFIHRRNNVQSSTDGKYRSLERTRIFSKESSTILHQNTWMYWV